MIHIYQLNYKPSRLAYVATDRGQAEDIPGSISCKRKKEKSLCTYVNNTSMFKNVIRYVKLFL